jgi:hypothetical protein
MKTMNPKTKIILVLLSLIIMFKACEEFKTENVQPRLDNSDYFKKLEQEKLAMQFQYESTIAQQEKENDSLKTIAEEKKKNLAGYRFKANYLQEQLKQLLGKADSTHQLPDSLSALATIYFEAENKNDTACAETIYSLEQVVANRDSTIVVFRQSETNLKDMQKDQQQRIELLTQELDTAYKMQKKKTRRFKMLSGALVFLSGLSTSLIAVQSLK